MSSRCRRANVTYEICCGLCESKYIGETARNAYTRGVEHFDAFRRGDKDSVLRRHAESCHRGIPPGDMCYNMRVTGHYSDSLTRQTAEAVKIHRTVAGLINTKCEYNHPAIPRAEISSV